MAFSWDATEVEGFDSLTDEENVSRDALIWATMAVGINSITVENVKEFFTRLSFWEKVVGPYRFDGTGPKPFKSDEVVRFIGLRTNASALTEAKFRNHVYETRKRFNIPSGL